MKVSGCITELVVKESSLIKLETLMRGSGIMIKPLELASITM